MKKIIKLLVLLWKNKKSFYLSCLIIVAIQVAVNLATVLLPKDMVDSLTWGNINRATVIALILCGVNFVSAVVLSIVQYIKSTALQKFNAELTTDLIRSSHSISYQKYEDFSTREEYEYAVKCANEGSAGAIVGYMLEIVSTAISLAGLFYIVGYVTWWLWIVIAASIVINTVCENYRIKYNYESTRSQNSVEMCMLYARDRLTWKSFAKEVRLYNMYNFVVNTAEKYIDELSDIQKERANKTFKALIWSYVFNAVQTVAVYIYIGYKCWDGTFSVGEFTMLVLAILSISQMTSGIASSLLELKEKSLYLKGYFDFTDSATSDSSDRNVKVGEFAELELRNVDFSYDGERNALNDISYKFARGKKYGIVGANGSGKSTFVHIMMGLYEATKGEVLVNGTNIRKMAKDEYYKLFSPVLQDYNMYAYTVGENIAMGENTNEDEIRPLLCKLGINERITDLGTYVSSEYDQSGTEFSGGEEQKLAIARAFLKNAPILVLDEPTSALSPRSEYELYQSINEYAQNKTVFFISHRMASCKMCDEIIVFDEGKITEHGSHDELMHQGGLYYRMFTTQAELYANDERGESDE